MPAPILAAPLVIPFAEAIGVSIAALGMAKATDKVNEFIQENPEQSIKIFQMIMPAQGIANILKNESSEGDEDMDEEVEVEKDPRSKKEIVLEGVRRAREGRGNYSSPDATGSAVSGRGNVIRGLEDAGKIRKGPNPNYDASKKYQGYKRFIRPKKADGGAIGIEVLLEEENPRQGLFMGGSPLTGQALSIYNSMNAYGFDDQAIADALAAQGLYTAPGSSTPETTTPNIINQQLQTGGGDNNFGGQGIGKFGNLDPNTLETMQVEVADGMGGTKIVEKQTALTAGGLRRTLDNKNPVNAGIDVKPMAITIMEALMGKKNDSEFDPEGKIYGTFNNPNYKDLSFFGKIKADYSRQKELKQLQKEFELQEKLKKQIAKEEADRAAQYGATNYGQGVGGQSYSGDAIGAGNLGFGIGATTGGPVSNRTGRGRQDYSKGGLATMFKEKR